MAQTKLTPLQFDVPLINVGQYEIDGTPTPYFIQFLQQLLDEKAITDDAVDAGLLEVDQFRIIARDDSGVGPAEQLTLSEVLDFATNVRGSILFRGAAGWVALAPNTDGKVLTTHGVGADPTWEAGSSGGILYGAGPPAMGLGAVGDFYFDTTALDLYGPKAALVGPKIERYWAIVIDNCNSTQIPSAAEIQFYDLTNTLIAPVTPFMIDNNGGFPTANMTDGNLANFCLTNRNNQTPREIFWVDMATAKEVDRIRYYRRNDGFGLNEAPTAVRIYAGATAPVAPWTPTTHKSFTMSWTGAAGEFRDLLQPQYNNVWPIALVS